MTTSQPRESPMEHEPYLAYFCDSLLWTVAWKMRIHSEDAARVWRRLVEIEATLPRYMELPNGRVFDLRESES